MYRAWFERYARNLLLSHNFQQRESRFSKCCHFSRKRFSHEECIRRTKAFGEMLPMFHGSVPNQEKILPTEEFHKSRGGISTLYLKKHRIDLNKCCNDLKLTDIWIFHKSSCCAAEGNEKLQNRWREKWNKKSWEPLVHGNKWLPEMSTIGGCQFKTSKTVASDKWG